MVSYGFPAVFFVVSQWFPYGSLLFSLGFPYDFRVVTLWFSYGFLYDLLMRFFLKQSPAQHSQARPSPAKPSQAQPSEKKAET